MLYADDTLLFTSGKNITSLTNKLSSNIEKLIQYFQAHQLNVNVNKTNFIVFGNKNQTQTLPVQNAKLDVSGEIIESNKEAKYLGVTLDQNLTFNTQISSILKKMAIGIRTIYTIRDRVPLQTRLLLLDTLVLSHLNYSILYLSNITENQWTSLDKQLNWALRACYYKSKRSSARELKLASKHLPIRILAKLRSTIYLSKLIHDRLPAYKTLQFPNLDYRINLRTSNLTLKMRAKSKALSSSFLFSTQKIWNTIPLQLRNIDSHDEFKAAIKLHFWNQFKQQPPDRIIGNVWNDFKIH